MGRELTRRHIEHAPGPAMGSSEKPGPAKDTEVANLFAAVSLPTSNSRQACGDMRTPADSEDGVPGLATATLSFGLAVVEGYEL